jgi:hypothetical protein
MGTEVPMTPLLLLIALLAPGFSQTAPPPQPPALSSPAEVSAFVGALGACTEAKAATPHPLMKSFVVEHTIAGATEPGCNYRQTMPGRVAMVCVLSEEGRAALAADINLYVSGGAMKGSSSGPQPAWWSECELEMPDGKRSPMASPGRN